MYFVIYFFVCSSIFVVSLYRKSFLVETSPNLFKLVGFCWSELSACAVVRLYCGGNIMLTFLNNHWWGRVLLESLYRKEFLKQCFVVFLALFHFLTLLPSWAVVVFWGQTPYSRLVMSYFDVSNTQIHFWLMFSSGSRIDKKGKIIIASWK